MLKPLSPKHKFSPAQSRAARQLLGWTAEILAQRAWLDTSLVKAYESGARECSETDRAKIGRTLYAAGVVAIPSRVAGEGVRLRRPSTSSTSAELGLATVMPFPVGLVASEDVDDDI